MDAYIKFQGDITEDDSYHFKELADLIREECDFSVKVEKEEDQPGVRDGGLAIGIAIASLTLAAIQTLISVLQYWESKQPKYSLSMTFRSSAHQETLLIESLSAQEIQEVISQLQSRSYPEYEYIEVQISKHQ